MVVTHKSFLSTTTGLLALLLLADGTGVPVGVPEAEATTQLSKSFPFSLVAKRCVVEVRLAREFHVVESPDCG
jgi:hypothetical protein